MDYVWYLGGKFREFITQIRAVMEVSKRPTLGVTFFTPLNSMDGEMSIQTGRVRELLASS